jgi:mono/diheme cytochrome c family protein
MRSTWLRARSPEGGDLRTTADAACRLGERIHPDDGRMAITAYPKSPDSSTSGDHLPQATLDDQSRDGFRGGGMRRLMTLAIGLVWLGATGAHAQDDVERFTDGDAAHGASLYKRYCAGCHGEDGRGGAHTFMPHVGNLAEKDYIEFIPDGFLFTVIAEGGVAVGKSGYMPAWRGTLSEQDIKDVIAFIRTLPTY